MRFEKISISSGFAHKNLNGRYEGQKRDRNFFFGSIVGQIFDNNGTNFYVFLSRIVHLRLNNVDIARFSSLF